MVSQQPQTKDAAVHAEKDFQKQFPDDATCLEWLKNRLYPDGIFCDACQAIHKTSPRQEPSVYSCDHCGHHVHPTAAHDLNKSPSADQLGFFYAVYLMELRLD